MACCGSTGDDLRRSCWVLAAPVTTWGWLRLQGRGLRIVDIDLNLAKPQMRRRTQAPGPPGASCQRQSWAPPWLFTHSFDYLARAPAALLVRSGLSWCARHRCGKSSLISGLTSLGRTGGGLPFMDGRPSKNPPRPSNVSTCRVRLSVMLFIVFCGVRFERGVGRRQSYFPPLGTMMARRADDPIPIERRPRAARRP